MERDYFNSVFTTAATEEVVSIDLQRKILARMERIINE
jgi:hypothetical protein